MARDGSLRACDPPFSSPYSGFAGSRRVIEYFAQESTRQGGIGLSNSADDMPAAVTFSYLALPTILAVLYALAWTWIDLDIRRIQPWLELSRSGGAGAESSLLLDYPFEFLAFVPFKAWKQRFVHREITRSSAVVAFSDRHVDTGPSF